MILQAVPAEDCDEEAEDQHDEDAALYGKSTGSGFSLPVRASSLRRVAALKDRVCTRSEPGPWWHPCRLARLGAGCLLAVLGVWAFLVLLGRYGEEAGGLAPGPRQVIAVFSYAPNTDAALAWLAATLLAGEPLPDLPAAAALLFAPGGAALRAAGGELDGIWQPSVEGARQLRALAHGGVSGMLRRAHRLGPPRLIDLTRPTEARGAASTRAPVPELDAFLAIRALLEAEAAPAEQPRARGSGGSSGKHRRLDGRLRQLVLVSHPHHVPYLAALAKASGFAPLGLGPALYGAVPWADFGCSSLGYPPGASPQEGVEREMARLGSYVEALRAGDGSLQPPGLEPVVRAANATLLFHLCVAARMGEFDGASALANMENASAVAAALQNCSDGSSGLP